MQVTKSYQSFNELMNWRVSQKYPEASLFQQTEASPQIAITLKNTMSVHKCMGLFILKACSASATIIRQNHYFPHAHTHSAKMPLWGQAFHPPLPCLTLPNYNRLGSEMHNQSIATSKQSVVYTTYKTQTPTFNFTLFQIEHWFLNGT